MDAGARRVCFAEVLELAGVPFISLLLAMHGNGIEPGANIIKHALAPFTGRLHVPMAHASEYRGCYRL